MPVKCSKTKYYRRIKWCRPLFCLFCLAVAAVHAQPLRVSRTAAAGSFAVAGGGRAASIVTDEADAEVVTLAAKALQHDIFLLSGLHAGLLHQNSGQSPSIVIGTLGRSRLIDQLVARKLLPVAAVAHKWETFCLSMITDPKHPQRPLLVIFGSDPRGTAFGVFELARMLGVSPWVWWADVKPKFAPNLYVRRGSQIVGPPSVKYRGFFINDEDWGMRPWAAKNMDKDLKDIGPRTYEKVFELMLRLKANYLWPAMHPGTKAFWYYPENPLLARRYDIVLGSSHHEPMLRDTEFEWNENFKEEYGKDHGEWRYDTNREEIYRFFDDRVKQSVNNDAIYTVGMRATKDGGMQGPDGMQGKIKILEHVIQDQRQLLELRLQKPASQIPQVFCPYKEVLEMYQAGLKVPDDVTITWVDDNHGYIRQLPDPAEQRRTGGSGVYYHFSYWGLPEDYLWLCSTSPVLTSFEMSTAYAMHARNIWMFNVGDIKPAELELEFAMDLAWNVKRWFPEQAHLYPQYWAGKTFGPEFAQSIGRIKQGYYALAAAGKPEQLDGTHFSRSEIDARLKAYDDLVLASRRVGRLIPARLKDAYFQLIAYPVAAASRMNQKYFYARESVSLNKLGDPRAAANAAKARSAYQAIAALTYQYNHVLSGGKWNGMMDDHPRGAKAFAMPALSDSGSRVKNEILPDAAVWSSATFTGVGNGHGTLRSISGLGVSGKGLTVWPLSFKNYEMQEIRKAPYAKYQVHVSPGTNAIRVKSLPTFPLYKGRKLRYAIAIDGSHPDMVDISCLAESKIWSANVLRGYAAGETRYTSLVDKVVSVRIYFVDPGLVLSAVESSAVSP